MEQANILPVNPGQLWKGCILAMCVHGVMLPEYPFTLNEHSWLNGLYITVDNEGGKGAVAFSDECLPLLGMFRSFDSLRTELALSGHYAASLYKSAPKEDQRLAKAMFVIFEEQVGEQILPMVTSGFWLNKDQVCSADSYDDWYINGGEILERQLMPFEEAMESYLDYYSIDPQRAGVIEKVYKERIQSPFQEVLLSKKEVQTIIEVCPYNKKACEDAFNSFSVYFEE